MDKDPAVTFVRETQEYKAGDGTLLVTEEITYPVAVIAGKADAAEKINQAVRNYAAYSSTKEELEKEAEADYKALGKENWHPYVLSTEFLSARTDPAVISFRVLSYSDMGGAHPNTGEAGLNFDARTGERLTLRDAAVDEQTAAERIRKTVLRQAKEKEKKEAGMFFEGYEEKIGSLLSEDTWYLAADGMHMIGNEYIISPHAAGILDFVIPYGEADFLKEEYRLPRQTADGTQDGEKG